MEAFSTRPFFSRKLPDDVKLSIVGGIGHWSSQKVACVCRDFRATVKKARELRLYGGQGLSVSMGRVHFVLNFMGRVYTWSDSMDYEPHEKEQDEDVLKRNRAQLGHANTMNELVPRLVETLVGVNVVGTAAGDAHTVVWTDEGKAYSFGNGMHGRLGHGGEEHELVPRLIEVRYTRSSIQRGGSTPVEEDMRMMKRMRMTRNTYDYAGPIWGMAIVWMSWCRGLWRLWWV